MLKCIPDFLILSLPHTYAVFLKFDYRYIYVQNMVMVTQRFRESDPGSSVLGDVLPWKRIDDAGNLGRETASRLRQAGMSPAAEQLEELLAGMHDRLLELASRPQNDPSASEQAMALIVALEGDLHAGIAAVTHADEGF
ncbi:MAG: hypothetical protein WC600_19045 [Desulfobaccales bacterium]